MRLLLSVFIFLTHMSYADSAPVELTLEKSVSTAIQNSFSVLKAENTVHLNAAQVLQSYGRFLPNLATTGSYSYQNGKTLYAITGLNLVDAKSRNANWTVTSRLNIFNGLADFASLKGAVAAKNAAGLSLDFARQQIALDVAQTYLQVVLDGQIVKIAEKNLVSSQQRLRLFQGEEEVGVVSVADLSRQQAQTSSDQVFLTNAITRQKDDLLLLVQKLRLDSAKAYEVKDPQVTLGVDVVPQSEDMLIASAMKGRLDFLSSEQSIQSAHWGVMTARSDYYPKLDLALSRSAGGSYLDSQIVNGVNTLPAFQSSLGSQVGNVVNYSAGLMLSWNIFDRFVTRLNVEQARISEDNLRLDQENLRLQIVSQIRQVKFDYAAAKSQYEATRVGVQAAEKADATITGQYHVGVSSLLDVLTAQTALVQAQSSQSQAAINLKLQEILLEYNVGNSLTTLMKD